VAPIGPGRRQLDRYRPAGAKPLTPSAAPPDLDDAYEAGPTAPGFDDLHGASPDEAADDRREPASSPFGPPGGEATPQEIERPDPFEQDIDPALLAAAAAELDAELHREPDTD
jgi:hypothetical protein